MKNIPDFLETIRNKEFQINWRHLGKFQNIESELFPK